MLIFCWLIASRQSVSFLPSNASFSYFVMSFVFKLRKPSTVCLMSLSICLNALFFFLFRSLSSMSARTYAAKLPEILPSLLTVGSMGSNFWGFYRFFCLPLASKSRTLHSCSACILTAELLRWGCLPSLLSFWFIVSAPCFYSKLPGVPLSELVNAVLLRLIASALWVALNPAELLAWINYEGVLGLLDVAANSLVWLPITIPMGSSSSSS